jgi:hypothetical protein
MKYSRKVWATRLLQAALAPLWRQGMRLNLFALQYSVTVRNAKLDAVETAIGTVPIIEYRTGAPPANCAAASTGTLLAQAALPSDWLAAAAAGVKSKLGTWQFTILAGISNQTVGYFRIFDSQSPSTCHIQGTVTATGGGGDMTVDNTNVSAGQTVTVTQYDTTAGNA